MSFPPVVTSESEKTSSWAKSMVDAIIQFHQTNAKTREATIRALYDAYNGIVKESTKKEITKKYGKVSSTSFVDFKIGNAKIKLLRGEFLDLKFTPTVNSINPDKIGERVDFAHLLKGASEMKEYLTDMNKAYGIKPLNGAEIPEKDDPELMSKMYPKTANEFVMQAIIDDKIERGRVKLKALKSFIDLIVISECHGVVETNAYGEDVMRFISPIDAIFQESSDDPFCLDSPFKGERKTMYIKDVFQKYKLGKKDREKLKHGYDEYGGVNEKGYRSVNGIPAVDVYILQWQSLKRDYVKVMPSKNDEADYRRTISAEDYEKNKKQHDYHVKKGDYTIEVTYNEELWQGVRIGEDVYPVLEPLKRQIQITGPNGKYMARYDYVNFLFGTVDGMRTSLQALMTGLSNIYNIVMHMIVREIKKLKGKVFVYDEALLPNKKSMQSVFYTVTEHGMIKINSSAEGNYSQRDITNATQLIQELDLGLSQSFNILLEVKGNLELTIDKITGINETREGYTAPSQTATGAAQNLEASRSITKEIFEAHQYFINEMLINLAEKTKLNKPYLNGNHIKILLGKEMYSFLRKTEELMFDEFDVKLSNGKEEKDIRERIRPLFDREINAGSLRAQDVIKFEMTPNINHAVLVLEEAYGQVNELRQQEMELQSENTNAQIEGQKEIAKENREDHQMHEHEITDKKTESAERIKAMDLEQRSVSDEEKIKSEKYKADKSAQNSNQSNNK